MSSGPWKTELGRGGATAAESAWTIPPRLFACVLETALGTSADKLGASSVAVREGALGDGEFILMFAGV
jgi:hypothetical protein